MALMLSIARYDTGDLPWQPMHASGGEGVPLVKDGPFAADLIRFAPGRGVGMHTHPGAHILIVISGRGTVECGEATVPLDPGVIYLVPSGVAHAVRANPDCELRLLSVASDHRPVTSADRLETVHA